MIKTSYGQNKEEPYNHMIDGKGNKIQNPLMDIHPCSDSDVSSLI